MLSQQKSYIAFINEIFRHEARRYKMKVDCILCLCVISDQ